MLSKKIFFISLFLALFFIILLTYTIIQNYKGNFTALVYAWEGFYNLNKKFFPEGFVIHTQGGYDGQFFYLIAYYLFSLDIDPPILDSFEIRFRRIGLSILGGILGSIFEWKNYGVATFVGLWIFHFLSSFVLYKLLLKSEQQYLCLIYLFSPFSWSSNFLLVSDSLFASFLIFTIYFMQKIGFSLIQEESNKKKVSIFLYMLSLFVIIFFLLIRETGIIFVFSFLLLAIYRKSRGWVWIFSLSIFVYSIFVVYVSFFHSHFSGTNSLSFLELIDFPFFGFAKTIYNFALEGGKSLLKIFLLLCLLFLALLQFYLAISKIFYLDMDRALVYFAIFIYSLLIVIAEEGYCSNYENLARFFTPCIPYILLVQERSSFSIKLYFAVVTFLFCVFLIKKFFQTPMIFFLS